MSKEKKYPGKDSGRVRVYVRVRPTTGQNDGVSNCQENSSLEIKPDNTQVQLYDAKLASDKWFKFDKVFGPTHSNYEVYSTVGQPVVQSVLNGFNGTIFAYGQTGSGKTHTLMASDGISVNLVNQLFSKICHDKVHNYKITCGYIQIYQEKIFDLLNSNQKMDLNVREDPNFGMFVENLSEYICHSPVDIFELLKTGRKRLVFAETRMNRQSSRSHSVFQITVEKSRKKNNANDTKITEPSQTEELPVRSSSAIPPISLSISNIPEHDDNIHVVRRTVSRNSTLKEKRLSLQPVPKPIRSRCISSGSLSRDKRTRSTDHVSLRRKSITSTKAIHPPTKPTDKSRVSRVESDKNLMHNSAQLPDSEGMTACQSNMSLSSDGISECDSITIEDLEWNAFNASTPDVFQYSASSLALYEQKAEEHQDGIDEADKLISIDDDMVLRGKINICDLAGCERIKKTHAEGERLQEAQHINLSLLELGNVIAALAAEGVKRTHIPYRNSILTRLLQDSLGGNCKTSFVLCVSPTMRDLSETKCTLDFGQRVLRISTSPQINVEVDHKRVAKDLQRKLDAKEREQKILTEDYERSMAEIKTELLSLKESLCDDEINNLRSEVERLQTELNVERQWNASTLDLDRTRSILLAQLMSVQLVYSMEDISRMSSISPENSISNTIENRFRQRDQTPIKEDIEEADNTRENHSPTLSLPSGYETGSCKSTISDDGKADTPDLDTCIEHQEHDITPIEERRQTHMSRLKQDLGLIQLSDSSQICSPLLTKLRAPYSPRRNKLLENLLESQLQGIGLDSIDLQDSSLLSVGETVNELRKEISYLKSSVDSELEEFFLKVFGEDTVMKHREDGHLNLNKRQLYSHAALRLAAPDQASHFTVHDLDQALNLVLLDHALIGCVLALAQHGKQNEGDKNSDKHFSRQTSKKSTSMEYLDAIDLSNREEERPDGSSNLSLDICEEDEIEDEMHQPIRKRTSFFKGLICGTPRVSRKKWKKSKK